MSFIFRAYHAMARQRPMSTRSGIPTAATYVFVNMLNKLREDFSPHYLAAVFDLSGPTFRDAQAQTVATYKKYDSATKQYESVDYAGYKANRAEMPPDLAQQVPFIRRALEAYRIPILSHQGFEADDVIGTLARLASEAGHPVYVVSSDKDMLQLVDEHVCVLNPPKDNLICDAAKVEEILGVPPRQVIDVMALRGDTIDNVPGAPGIGDKGSVELIKQFGSVENALDHADQVQKKSYRESLQNNREMVLLSKQLVTIDKFVPVELDLDAMTARPPDPEACRILFTELEFHTLLKNLAPAQSDLGATDYIQLKSAGELKDFISSARLVAVALNVNAEPAADEPSDESETPQRPPAVSGDLFAEPDCSPQAPAACEVGIAIAEGKAASVEGGALDSLRGKSDPAIAVHDWKAALRAQPGLLPQVQHDTMLYSYLLDMASSNHNLASVTMRRLNVNLPAPIPVAQAADITLRLTNLLRAEVEQQDLLSVYNMIDLPFVKVLATMEEHGVKIDLDVLAELSIRLGRECEAKAQQIYASTGEKFNINSPKQLGEVLFNKMNLPKPIKYGKGKTISTAVDVLEELASSHEVPRMVLDYRQLSKLRSTYVDALPSLVNAKSGRVHTTFNQAATATGRLSSTNPNLQNIPIRTEQGREIRAAFVAEKGNVLLAADYSQIELRLLAHYSQDKLLTHAFRNGEDIHSLTASEVFGVPPMAIDAEHRRRAKAVNFGIVYGLSPFGLAQQLGIEQREAKKYIESYFEKYSGVRQFIDATLEQTRKDSFVCTLFGRMRPIPDINSKNGNMRGFAERTAVNTPLQGTAADLIKLAMIRIQSVIRKTGMKTRMTLQVHDELVFEVPQEEVADATRLVRAEMENVHPLHVPLVVDIGVGKNWRDMEDIE